MRQTYNPGTVHKEAKVLYELGVPEYDIQNLLAQKRKHELEARWN